jgi:Galactose oxidase, central domain
VTPSGRVFLYGGELKPRSPVDADPTARGSVHSLNLSGAKESVAVSGDLKWSSASSPTHTAASAPDPRVGAASVTIGEYLYVWGGRGGVNMSPLPGSQAGIWRCFLGAEDAAPNWERIGATNEQDAPQIRSYHAMTKHGVCHFPDQVVLSSCSTVSLYLACPQNTIYVHAGCPEKGRISELHAFDLTTKGWTALASAPEPGRGGTVLAAVQLNGRPVLLRFGGRPFALSVNSDLHI